MEYKVGQKLKRKFHDFQEVEIVGVYSGMLIVKDSNGKHWMNIDKIKDFFTEVEIKKK